MTLNSTHPVQPHPLHESLAQVKHRIESACTAAHRAPSSVTLLAVSKTFPAGDVVELARAGQTHFGENYLQEALDKIAQVKGAGCEHPLSWHFIGPIQSNKTRPIAEHFDWVHSVDRLKIAQRLSDQRPEGLPPLNVCVQVNISGEDSKSGCTPEEAVALALDIAALPRLHLRGLMAIPDPTLNTQGTAAAFEALRTLFEHLQESGLKVDTLSMGMSADLELAIAHGSTCVRVGTALFGARSAPTP